MDTGVHRSGAQERSGRCVQTRGDREAGRRGSADLRISDFSEGSKVCTEWESGCLEGLWDRADKHKGRKTCDAFGESAPQVRT